MHQSKSKGHKALYSIATSLCFIVAALFLLCAIIGLKSSIIGSLFCLVVTAVFIHFGVIARRASRGEKAKRRPNHSQNETKPQHTVPAHAKIVDDNSVSTQVMKSVNPETVPCNAKSVIAVEKINIRDDKTIMALHDFLVVDVETTGLNQTTDRIVEISILKVVDNEITSEYSTLVNPEIPISPRASSVNGIYDSTVVDAPKYVDIAGHVATLLSNSVVIGHNVTFDLSFIKQLLSPLGIQTTIYYLDTLYYSRRFAPGLDNYKLQTLLEYFSIDPGSAHRASSDAAATLQLFIRCREEYTAQKTAAAEKRKAEQEQEKRERREKYKHSPLLEKTFVFTGDFSIGRDEAESLIDSVGGLLRQSVTSKTNYLIVGDISDLPQWALERKYEKAQSLLADGQDIQILDEDNFRALIKEAKAQIATASK